ncbi:hypothetical protein EOD41_03915 [Mucilaginibacter limnophilus]|uniref:Uncharacterized protein n=1 Tax=Mucilaginibacter limnophilus TaxID=1932778 RepID=A0A3S2VAV5_9SPHI|nr:hypothetical protein [Mucilaginibacter limnophilus]RVU03089.1 hypothetical protein EOD41_03915 [Mucilaginibacter limnophilus]
MKKITLITILGIASLAACNSGGKKDQTDSLNTDTSIITDTTKNVSTTGEACFLHTDGTKNQDSTKVHLIINGNKVSGDMLWLPAEKDSRKGTLQGTQDGNTIKAVWTFMQEGMQDTIAVEFDFPGDVLKQKPLKADLKSGRQVTDTAADYTVVYKKVDCE